MVHAESGIQDGHDDAGSLGEQTGGGGADLGLQRLVGEGRGVDGFDERRLRLHCDQLEAGEVVVDDRSAGGVDVARGGLRRLGGRRGVGLELLALRRGVRGQDEHQQQGDHEPTPEEPSAPELRVHTECLSVWVFV